MMKNVFKEADIERLRSIVAEGNVFVLTCHAGPDGDALGSTLGFAHYLNALGKEAVVVVPDAFFKVILSTSGKQPRALGFIFENKNTRQHLGKYAKSIDEVEALTGINFFPALPDDIEVAVEKQINLRSWGLD